MTRRGRRTTNRLDLLEHGVDRLIADPTLAARPGELRALLGAREADVRRMLRALHRLNGVELPAARRGRPKKCSPISPEGDSEGAGQ